MDDLYIPTESEEQKEYFRWVEKSINPKFQRLIWHTPNGGYRDKKTAMRLKEEGVKPGVPDITIATARGGYHGAYLEMKRIKKNKVSPEQAEMIEALRAQGYYVEICLGADQAKEKTKYYLSLKQNTII